MTKEFNQSEGVRVSRRAFLKAGGVGVTAALLAACGFKPIEELPTNTLVPPTNKPFTPTIESTQTPKPTLKSTDTPTPTRTATSEPTNTPTPEIPAYVPGGFEIGPGGLMPDGNGKNLLGFNPEAEASWNKFYIDFLTEYRKALRDWGNFKGIGNDAFKYATAEAFIKDAMAGKVFNNLAIPVRDPVSDYDPSQYKDWEKTAMRDGAPCFTMFKAVHGVRLDKIKIQALPPDKFKEFMGGKDWMDPTNEALSEGVFDDNIDAGVNPIAFSIDPETGQLIITTGSYYFGNNVFTEDSLYMGRPDPSLHEAHPEFFLPSGLTNWAAEAFSTLIAIIPGWLTDMIPTYSNYPTKSGGWAKLLTINREIVGLRSAVGYSSKSWFLNPKLFVFSQ